MPTKSNYSECSVRGDGRRKKERGRSSRRTSVGMIFMESGCAAQPPGPRANLFRSGAAPPSFHRRADKRVSSFNLQRQISGSWVIRIRVTSILSRFPYIGDITRQPAAPRPRNLNQFLRKPAATRWAL